MSRKEEVEQIINEAEAVNVEIGVKESRISEQERIILEKERELNEEKIKLHRMKKDLANAVKRPQFKKPRLLEFYQELLDEMNQLKRQLRKLVLDDDGDVDRKTEASDNRDTECKICLTDATGKTIYECLPCGNWVCGDCQEKDLGKCPTCRICLQKHPLHRSRALEKLLF